MQPISHQTYDLKNGSFHVSSNFSHLNTRRIHYQDPHCTLYRSGVSAHIECCSRMTLFFVRFHKISANEAFATGLTVEWLHLKMSVTMLSVVALILKLPATEFTGTGPFFWTHTVGSCKMGLKGGIPPEHF